MSLQPKEITPVPEETVRVARAAFPKGNAWLSLRDELGTIYSDEMWLFLGSGGRRRVVRDCRAIGGQAALASTEAGSTIWNSCPKLDPSLPLRSCS